MRSITWYDVCSISRQGSSSSQKGERTMENLLDRLEMDELERVTGGSGPPGMPGPKLPTPKGGDGASIGRWDRPTYPRLPDDLKGKTKGNG
jgi:hypothetical protein